MTRYNALLHGTHFAWDIQRKPAFGGGGGSGELSDEEKAYYQKMGETIGAQNDANTPYLGQASADFQRITQERLDPSYVDRQRGRAVADAEQASAMGLDSIRRNLGRSGINLNSGRALSAMGGMQDSAIKNRIHAGNTATRDAENDQLKIADNAFSTRMGMTKDTLNGLSNVANGYGNMATREANANQASMQGWGNAIGTGLAMGKEYNWFKDGGKVPRLRLALGGPARRRAPNPMLRQAPRLMNAAGKAFTQAANAGNVSGSGAMAGNIGVNSNNALTGLAAQETGMHAPGMALGADTAATAGLGDVGTLSTLAAQDAAVLGGEAALSTGTTAALAEGAGMAGAGAAASGGMAALGTALPVVGAALGIGSMLGLFKDGGKVKMRQAGKYADGGKLKRAEQIESALDRAARTTGMDRELLDTVARVESNRNPNAVSSAGARGVMQLMPGTAKMYGVKDPHNIEQNIMAGARYLKDMVKRFDGDTVKAIAAYNWGPGNVSKHGLAKAPRETRDYIRKIHGDEVADALPAPALRMSHKLSKPVAPKTPTGAASVDSRQIGPHHQFVNQEPQQTRATKPVQDREPLPNTSPMLSHAVMSQRAASRGASPLLKPAVDKAQWSKVSPSSNYTIRKGDTLSKIAARHGTTIEDLAKANGIDDPDLIIAGKTLNIPGELPVEQPQKIQQRVMASPELEAAFENPAAQAVEAVYPVESAVLGGGYGTGVTRLAARGMDMKRRADALEQASQLASIEAAQNVAPRLSAVATKYGYAKGGKVDPLEDYMKSQGWENADKKAVYEALFKEKYTGKPEQDMAVLKAFQDVDAEDAENKQWDRIDTGSKPRLKMANGGKSWSIVEYMKSQGIGSSFKERKQLYEDRYGGRYRGSATQNAKLLGDMKKPVDVQLSDNEIVVLPDGTPKPINGPGTETSDSIKTSIPEGSYVVNADAAKLPGVKQTLNNLDGGVEENEATLEQINTAGLRLRQARDGGRIKMARGGNIGDALSAGLGAYLGTRRQFDQDRDRAEDRVLRKQEQEIRLRSVLGEEEAIKQAGDAYAASNPTNTSGIEGVSGEADRTIAEQNNAFTPEELKTVGVKVKGDGEQAAADALMRTGRIGLANAWQGRSDALRKQKQAEHDAETNRQKQAHVAKVRNLWSDGKLESAQKLASQTGLTLDDITGDYFKSRKTLSEIGENEAQAGWYKERGTQAASGGGSGGSAQVQYAEATRKALIPLIGNDAAAALAYGKGKLTMPVERRAMLITKLLDHKDENGEPMFDVRSAQETIDSMFTWGAKPGSGAGQKPPADPANIGKVKSYLDTASDQDDFNQRVRELRKQGWTADQIKRAMQ